MTVGRKLKNVTRKFRWWRLAALLLGVYLLIVGVFWFLWDYEPDPFDVESSAQPVTGYHVTWALIRATRTLLDKPGGYLSNDVAPPGLWMDNIPEWEFGVIIQVRDMVRVMRNDLSRSQSQSQEDPDLADAEGKLFFDNSRWILPRSEAEYAEGIVRLQSYLARLADPGVADAQFFSRADNLVKWLQGVETRLGSLSQRLSASVGKRQLDVDLAGDTAARKSTETSEDTVVKTPWTEIDNVFYESRGQAWALLHLLQAVEIDFREVLIKKNALVSLRQLIREIEGSQQYVWSPVILNGDGFGLVANHSLVMASYLSRANAAIIDLRNLLEQG